MIVRPWRITIQRWGEEAAVSSPAISTQVTGYIDRSDVASGTSKSARGSPPGSSEDEDTGYARDDLAIA